MKIGYHYMMTKKSVLELNDIPRPPSAPSKVDTKTKIKRNQSSLTLNYRSSTDYNNKSGTETVRDDLDSNDGETLGKSTALKSIEFASKSKDLSTIHQEQQQPIMQPHKIISKLFETQETNLKTNSKMHPVDVKSKLPNPKIINLIRPQTSLDNNNNNNNVTHRSGQQSTTLSRSKSAFFDANPSFFNSSNFVLFNFINSLMNDLLISCFST